MFSKKESESFSQYVTRISSFIVAISTGILLFDTTPEIHQIARKVLVYITITWVVFVGIPFIFRKAWEHRRRIKWKWLLEIIVIFADHYSKRSKREDEDKYSTLDYNAGSMGSSSQFRPQPPRINIPKESVEADKWGELPEIYRLLPHNPRPVPSATVTEDIAAEAIQKALELSNFSVDEPPQILSIESGPTLQKLSFTLPPKVQISKLLQRKDDLANHLGHSQGFDVATSPYPSSAAFVIPHKKRAFVYVRDIAFELERFAKKANLPVCFGKTMVGEPILVDLSELPHLLVAGATGSGKSVSINAMIGSLQLTRSPKQVKLVMIDPKLVEFAAYRDSPHLLLPVVTDVKRAAITMQKVVTEMEKRYERFAKVRVRNIEQYNKNHEDLLPYIVIFIDEYADLMLTVRDMVEDTVQRITQMGRAAGIHLVLGTQRPSVDVVTGVIKSNLPSRVAFRLPSPHDFKTVMDGSGPHLLGKGDGVCLFNDGVQQRIQAAAITGDDDESVSFIEAISDYWRKRVTSSLKWEHDQEEEQERDQGHGHEESSTVLEEGLEHKWVSKESAQEEPTNIEGSEYEMAIRLAQKNHGVTPLLLQKTLRIDYITAARIVERMVNEGLVGDMNFEKGMRPWLETKETDEQILERMKLYIFETQTARVGELQKVLCIRKERVGQLMSKLCEEGILNPPESPKTGYTIAWDQDKMDAFLTDRAERERGVFDL